MDNPNVSDFDAFLGEVRSRLSRAFVAAYGFDRGREALAEALAYAWEHRDQLQAMDNPAGYLYRVGQSRTRSRRRSPVVFPSSVEEIPEMEPGLPAALAALTERQRSCVVLVFALEWTHQEVADLLGLSRSAVQNHVERGLAHLRRAIGAMTDA